MDVHHLDGTACQTESHGPHRALSCPVNDLVEGGQDVFCNSSAVIQILGDAII